VVAGVFHQGNLLRAGVGATKVIVLHHRTALEKGRCRQVGDTDRDRDRFLIAY